MAVVTQQQLEDAARDLEDLEKVVTGAADLNGDGLVPTRSGGSVKTLRRALEVLTIATGLYDNTTAGLAATSDGEYFAVLSGDSDESFLLYENVSSVATLRKTYPTAEALDNTFDGVLEPSHTNVLLNGDFSDGDPDFRTTVTKVDLTTQTDLLERGYTRGIQWNLGNNFARHDAGEDVNGDYFFGCFFAYSTNADNLSTLAGLMYTEASGGGLTILTGGGGGVISLSDECKLVYYGGQANNAGDENVLIGTSVAPVDTTRFASGFHVFRRSSSAFDGLAMARLVLMRTQVQKLIRDWGQTIADAAVAPILARGHYMGLQNVIENGDFYGGVPDTRSNSIVSTLPAGPLRDRGYRRGILWASEGTSEFFRYSTSADLDGKYIFAAFLVWSESGAGLPFSTAMHTETAGGALDAVTTIASGNVDLGDNVYLLWQQGLADGGAGYVNALFGSSTDLDDTYATGVFMHVSDTEIDETLALTTYYLREAIMKDAARQLPEPAPGLATLVLNGPGDSDVSYVESSLSGTKLRREFIPFPVVETVADHPQAFDIRADYVNDVEIRAGSDDTAPYRVLGATIGADHGWAMSLCTATAHGKTQADQGAVYDKGGTEYVLVSVVDANTLYLTERAGNGTVTSGTFTHVSGGSDTNDIVVTGTPSAAQWRPVYTDYSMRVLVDGETVTDQYGTFQYRDSVQFVETYAVLDKSEVVAWWEANGASGNLYPDGDASFVVTITYEYDRDGQLTIYSDFLALQSIAIQDLMFLQAARSDMTHFYVPKALAFTHDATALDYANIEVATHNTTGGLSTTLFTPARCEPSGILVDRIIALRDSDYFFAMGFLPVAAAGVSARRTNVTDQALELRAGSDKMYLYAVDTGGGTLSIGDQYAVIGYRHIGARPTERTDAYVVRTQGADYVFVDWHNKVAVDMVPLPPDLAGRDFSVVEKSDTVTLRSTVLTGLLAVDVDASGDYGYLILKVEH